MAFREKVVEWMVGTVAGDDKEANGIFFTPRVEFRTLFKNYYDNSRLDQNIVKIVDGLIRIDLYHLTTILLNKQLPESLKTASGEDQKEALEKTIAFLKRNAAYWADYYSETRKRRVKEILDLLTNIQIEEELYTIETYASLVDAVVDRQILGKPGPVLFHRKEAPETPEKEPADDESWYHGPLLKFKKGAKGLSGAIADSCRWVQDKYVAADKYLTRRVGGTYAFTWWKVTKKDAEKLLNGHYYPRFRGDMKAGFTEIPNKKIERFLMGQEKNFGKFEGQVDGEYLGWMGLTEKGWIGAKEEGQLVPQFTTGEDEVVMLGVAHLLRFDLMRLKFNGVNGWKFDWGELTWKWDIWDPAKGSDAPGPIKVRVLLWDNDKDDGKDARSYLEKFYRMPLEYEDVIENHQEFIKNNFDQLFSLRDAGVKTEVAVFDNDKKLLGTKETDKKGRTEFTAFQPGLMIETVAGKTNYVGIHVNEEEYASRAPALYLIDKETSEISPETHLKHRYITTVRKKDPVKRVLIIVQKKENTLEDTEIVLMPATDGDKHKKPLKEPYGSDKERSFTSPMEGNDFVFHVTKTKQTKAVPNDYFSYYLFLAKKNGKTYLEVQPINVQDAEVTVLYRGIPFKNKNGLYRVISREKKGENYWTTGGGNEVIVPNFTPKNLDAGVYRLYCVALKGAVLAEGWAPPQKMLKKKPGDCTDHENLFWDFNFIDFVYGEKTLEKEEASKKKEKEADNVIKKTAKAAEKAAAAEKKSGPHNLYWQRKEELKAMKNLWGQLKKAEETYPQLLKILRQEKHYETMRKLMLYCLLKGTRIESKLDILGYDSQQKKEILSGYDKELGKKNSQELEESFLWLAHELKMIRKNPSWLKEVAEGTEFTYHRSNGKITSLRQLHKALETIDDEEFNIHFNDERNSFADWVEESVGQPALAEALRRAKSKEEMREALLNYEHKG